LVRSYAHEANRIPKLAIGYFSVELLGASPWRLMFFSIHAPFDCIAFEAKLVTASSPLNAALPVWYLVSAAGNAVSAAARQMVSLSDSFDAGHADAASEAISASRAISRALRWILVWQ
jgi:hypothetical protein